MSCLTSWKGLAEILIRKFAAVKRMINPNDSRLFVHSSRPRAARRLTLLVHSKSVQEKAAKAEEEKKKAAVQHVYVSPSLLPKTRKRY